MNTNQVIQPLKEHNEEKPVRTVSKTPEKKKPQQRPPTNLMKLKGPAGERTKSNQDLPSKAAKSKAFGQQEKV